MARRGSVIDAAARKAGGGRLPFEPPLLLQSVEADEERVPAKAEWAL